MRMVNARYAIAAMAIGGFAAGGLLGSGPASADLIDDVTPLLMSSCSFAQIDAALHVVAPDAAARLDAAPLQKSVLALAFSQPADKRQAMFGQIATQRQRMNAMTGIHPGGAALPAEKSNELSKAAETCHKY